MIWIFGGGGPRPIGDLNLSDLKGPLLVLLGGLACDFLQYGWQSVGTRIVYVRRNKDHLAHRATTTPESDDYVSFSDAIATGASVFFYLKGLCVFVAYGWLFTVVLTSL